MSISDQNVEILQIADEAMDSYTSSQFQARGTAGWETKLTLVPFSLIMHNQVYGCWICHETRAQCYKNFRGENLEGEIKPQILSLKMPIDCSSIRNEHLTKVNPSKMGRWRQNTIGTIDELFRAFINFWEIFFTFPRKCFITWGSRVWIPARNFNRWEDIKALFAPSLLLGPCTIG